MSNWHHYWHQTLKVPRRAANRTGEYVMENRRNGIVKKISREIGQEAARQLRGFPGEFRRQITGGWDHEFARQLFGNPSSSRRRRNHG